MEAQHAEISTYHTSRRNFLKLAPTSVLALWYAAQTGKTIAAAQRETRVALPLILIYLHGGASHKEMFDPDPQSVAKEFRGPLDSIQTSVTGMHFCSLWEKSAQHAHRMSIVRSILTGSSEHDASTNNMMLGNSAKSVGYRWGIETAKSGSAPYALVFAPHSKEHFFRDALQPDVALGFHWTDDEYNQETDEFTGHYEAGITKLSTEERETLQRRRELSKLLSGNHIYSATADAYEANAILGMSLFTGGSSIADALHPRAHCNPKSATPEIQQVYARDIANYQKRIDRYGGDNPHAQALLLASELIDKGVQTVAVNHLNHVINFADNWDDHGSIERNMRRRVPPLDHALSGLIGEMCDEVARPKLIALITDFDRSPKMNQQAGRDHWPTGTLVLVAPEGCAIYGGSTYGKKSYDGTITSKPLKARDGAVVNTIIHAAANGNHSKFLTPDMPRAKDIMLHSS